MKMAHFKEACIPSPSTPPTFHTSLHIIHQPKSSLTSSLHPTFFSQFLYHLHTSFSITPTVLRIAVFFLCHLWLSQPPILSFLAYVKHPFCHLTSSFLHVSPLCLTHCTHRDTTPTPIHFTLCTFLSLD